MVEVVLVLAFGAHLHTPIDPAVNASVRGKSEEMATTGGPMDTGIVTSHTKACIPCSVAPQKASTRAVVPTPNAMHGK